MKILKKINLLLDGKQKRKMVMFTITTIVLTAKLI